MHHLRRMRLCSGCVALLLAGPAIPASELPNRPATRPGAEFKISIGNFAFTPMELSVPVGATVTWVNHDDVPHTATSKADPRAFDSRPLDTGEKYSFIFTKSGRYSYFCKVHTHMTGTVVVQ